MATATVMVDMVSAVTAMSQFSSGVDIASLLLLLM